MQNSANTSSQMLLANLNQMYYKPAERSFRKNGNETKRHTATAVVCM